MTTKDGQRSVQSSFPHHLFDLVPTRLVFHQIGDSVAEDDGAVQELPDVRFRGEVTERFRRTDFGHLQIDVTIDDPKAYTRPWKADTMRFTLLPDTELLEHLCESNCDLANIQRFWRGQEKAQPSTSGR
jgi:hypothetical protein